MAVSIYVISLVYMLHSCSQNADKAQWNCQFYGCNSYIQKIIVKLELFHTITYRW